MPFISFMIIDTCKIIMSDNACEIIGFISDRNINKTPYFI